MVVNGRLPLKHNYISKRMSNADVTLKVTLFFLNLVLKLESYLKKKIQKKFLLEKFLKLHLSSFTVILSLMSA